jgi:hypothetical protein
VRTRKPTDVHFPVPNLGFQTDEFVDGLICNCADPENCTQAIPNRICKAGRTIWQDDSTNSGGTEHG